MILSLLIVIYKSLIRGSNVLTQLHNGTFYNSNGTSIRQEIMYEEFVYFVDFNSSSTIYIYLCAFVPSFNVKTWTDSIFFTYKNFFIPV